jgi:hypothetical protein
MAERELSKELNIFLVIHMDPINTDNHEVNKAKMELENLLKRFPIVKSMHDFRIVGNGEYKNLIFDLVIEHAKGFTQEDEERLKRDIDIAVKGMHPLYNSVITVDRDFTAL